jgi:muramoyltetrapeptide carboxypeptidase
MHGALRSALRVVDAVAHAPEAAVSDAPGGGLRGILRTSSAMPPATTSATPSPGSPHCATRSRRASLRPRPRSVDPRARAPPSWAKIPRTMERRLPPRLRSGDTLRVVAPARSLAIIPPAQRAIADARLASIGLRVTFGAHVEECDAFRSSSVAARVADLHAAFADPDARGVITVIGGFNSNQLLAHLDYDLIAAHPKVLCGYSDITALGNAIYAKTGLVTYSGPHYSSFAMRRHFEYTEANFVRCLFDSAPFDLAPSDAWSDDAWFLDQDNRTTVPNGGPVVLSEGAAEGALLGGNLCTFNLLHGTEFMPPLDDAILFVEDDEAPGAFADVTFDRDLQSVLHLPAFRGVRGLLIGRFQKRSEMTVDKLRAIVASKPELAGLPVVCDVDFGHTTPFATLPIGGTARLEARGTSVTLRVLAH